MMLFGMLMGHLCAALGFFLLRESVVNRAFEPLLGAIVAGFIAAGFYYLGVVANM